MLALVCVVVNDGSVVLAEMEDNHVVCKLKKTIKEKKMYTFPADELTLFVAKSADGQWLHLSDDDDVKLQKREKIDAVEALLKKRPMNSVSRLDNRSFGFGADDAGEDVSVHVLVVVPAARWEEARSTKKSKTSAYPLEFTLETDSVFVPNNVTEGTLQCTKDLSTPFQDFGGFPEALLVRQEMQMVWTILRDNYVDASTPRLHYALVGSPGVGKSALLVLFCCHLAVHEGFNIYLARRLKTADDGCSSNVVLLFRGSEVTGYRKCHSRQLCNLMDEFEAEHKGTKYLIVCDGYLQSQFDNVMEFFTTCHLLATSAQYTKKSDDERKLLLLPAWQPEQLEALATAMGIEDVDLRYAYSGGSAREFTRDLEDLKEAMALALQTNDSAPTNSGRDSVQRLFVTNVDKKEAYLKPSTWLSMAQVNAKFD